MRRSRTEDEREVVPRLFASGAEIYSRFAGSPEVVWVRRGRRAPRGGDGRISRHEGRASRAPLSPPRAPQAAAVTMAASVAHLSRAAPGRPRPTPVRRRTGHRRGLPPSRRGGRPGRGRARSGRRGRVHEPRARDGGRERRRARPLSLRGIRGDGPSARDRAEPGMSASSARSPGAEARPWPPRRPRLQSEARARAAAATAPASAAQTRSTSASRRPGKNGSASERRATSSHTGSSPSR